MTIGTKLFWNGNLGSDACGATITAIKGDMVSLLWDNGRTGVAPICTIAAKYGWVIG